MSPRLALAGLLAFGLASSALGAARPRKPKPPKPATIVNLENKRSVPLLAFEVVMLVQDTSSKDTSSKEPLGQAPPSQEPIGKDTPDKDTPANDIQGKDGPRNDSAAEAVVGRLEKPLGPGESVSLPLTGAKGCSFEARWQFADVADVGSVDLCNDAHIVLVD